MARRGAVRCGVKNYNITLHVTHVRRFGSGVFLNQRAESVLAVGEMAILLCALLSAQYAP